MAVTFIDLYNKIFFLNNIASHLIKFLNLTLCFRFTASFTFDILNEWKLIKQ